MGEPGAARLLSVDRAAAYLGVSPRTVWRMVERGELLALRLGGRTLISVAELDDFVKRLDWNEPA